MTDTDRFPSTNDAMQRSKDLAAALMEHILEFVAPGQQDINILEAGIALVALGEVSVVLLSYLPQHTQQEWLDATARTLDNFTNPVYSLAGDQGSNPQ